MQTLVSAVNATVNAACAGDMSHRRSRRCRPGPAGFLTRAHLFPDPPHRLRRNAYRRPGWACTSGDFQPVGNVHPLRIDFARRRSIAISVAKRRSASPVAIARASSKECRDHGAGRAKCGIARHHDIGASGQRPADRDEGLATHHHRLAQRQRLEALPCRISAATAWRRRRRSRRSRRPRR